MKMSNIKYLLYIVCGVICFGSLMTSCHMEDLGPIPQEELYIRGFIQKYGLIDPNQNWNLAQRKTVTVNVDYADEINVFAKVCDRMYRVAYLAEVEGAVNIPVDVPEGTNDLYVSIDGVMYETTVGGTVNPAASKSRAGSRAVPSVAVWKTDWSDGSNGLVGNNAPATVALPTTGKINCTTSTWANSHSGEGNDKQIQKRKGRNYELTNLREGDHLHFVISTANEENTPTSYNLTFKTQYTGNKTINISVVILDQNNKVYLDAVTPLIKNANTTSNTELGLDDEGGKVDDYSIYIPHLPKNGTYQMIVSPQSTFNTPGGAGVWGAFEIKEATSYDTADMSWLIAAEDLGATDDFDFNDVVIRISSITMNTASLYIEEKQWQVVTDPDANVSLTTRKPMSRVANDGFYTRLEITALSAGGILDSYLHFYTGSVDYVLKPGDTAVDLTGTPSTATYKNVKLTDASVSNPVAYEWHNWFVKPEGGTNGDEVNKRLMLNTGYTVRSVKSAIIVVPADFSMSKYSVRYNDYGMEGTGHSYSDFFDNNGNFKYDQSEMWKDNWSYDGAKDKILGFYMTVGDADPDEAIRVLGASRPGSAPQMFLIPDAGWYGSWYWPYERVDITHVYPSFSKWVNDSQCFNWYAERPAESQRTKEDVLIAIPYIKRSDIPNLE